MTKAEKIANFIEANNPRRKDIIKFIVVTLNGVNEAYFDNNKNEFRGYYAVAFQSWNRNQKVQKDAKTQRYSLTHYYKRDGKLYAMPTEVRLDIALRSREGLIERVNQLFYENRILKRKLKQIQDLVS